MVDELRARLRTLIGTRDLGNGTPLAEATSDAIRLESAALGIDPADVVSLTDEELKAAANTIHAHLNIQRHPPRRLVFGTQLSSFQGLNVGQEVYRPDAARPGLFEFLSLPREVTGPNLTKLMAILTVKLDEHPYNQFGKASVARLHVGGASQYLEFSPILSIGGTILKQRVADSWYPPFCSWMPHHFVEFMNDTADNMDMLLSRKGEVAERARQIKAAWRASAGGPSVPELSNVSIDWFENIGEDGDYPHMFAEYRGLDSRLEHTTILAKVSGHDELNNYYFGQYFQHQKRLEDRKKDLAKLRAFSLIDGVTASVIRAAKEGEESLVKRILTEDCVYFDFANFGAARDSYLMWVSGRIKVSVTSRTYRLNSHEFAIKADLPDSLLLASKGRTLASLVELPVLIDAQILDARREPGGWICFKLEQTNYLVDRDSQAIGSVRFEL